MYYHNKSIKQLIASAALAVLLTHPAYADIIAIPYTFTPGQTLPAASLNGNFTTIYNNYNGNITDANIKSTAAIQITKLAQIASNSVLALDSATARRSAIVVESPPTPPPTTSTFSTPLM